MVETIACRREAACDDQVLIAARDIFDEKGAVTNITSGKSFWITHDIGVDRFSINRIVHGKDQIGARDWHRRVGNPFYEQVFLIMSGITSAPDLVAWLTGQQKSEE